MPAQASMGLRPSAPTALARVVLAAVGKCAE